MKSVKLFGMLLLGAALSCGIASCGDNDEPIKASTSATVNGSTFKVNRAYWNVAELNENDVFYAIQLCNSDITNPSDPFTAITIIYNVPGGPTDTFATGEFSDFDVALTTASSDSSKDRQFYGFSNEDGNNAKLKVSKDGGITVEVDAMNYKLEPTATELFPGTAFSFTGSVKRAPQE